MGSKWDLLDNGPRCYLSVRSCRWAIAHFLGLFKNFKITPQGMVSSLEEDQLGVRRSSSSSWSGHSVVEKFEQGLRFLLAVLL